MKEKLLIFGVLILLALVLAGLNAAAYIQKEKTPDSELSPNRSTFNSGTTGSQALYSLLAETGRNVVRWQSPPDALLTETSNRPSTFVVIGPVRKEFTDLEITHLLQWVAGGNRLVVVDRNPPTELVRTDTQWEISLSPSSDPTLFAVDSSDQRQMTDGVSAVKPVQPTPFAANIIAVQPSRFASMISIAPFEKRNEDSEDFVETEAMFAAPVVHFSSEGRNLLVDFPFGAGQIVVLSDPFIVSNSGIGLVDNAKLAVNIVENGDGVIAFDEYHQGYGSNNNRLFQYFEGTPVIAIFLQCALLAGFVLFSQSRRFARAVPEPEPDRLSKLEYVSAMAELQQRTKAFDLAIENVYVEFRRRAARLFGLDNTITKRDELAARIAERTNMNASEIDDLMFKCEDIIHGEPTNRKETVRLMGLIRELEEKLGIKRVARTRI